MEVGGWGACPRQVKEVGEEHADLAVGTARGGERWGSVMLLRRDWNRFDWWLKKSRGRSDEDPMVDIYPLKDIPNF